MSRRTSLIVAVLAALGVAIGLCVVVSMTLHAFGCAMLFNLPQEC